MAVVTISHHPELTPKGVMEIFRRHFEGKYDVYAIKSAVRHFVIKKSGWRAVNVRLKQDKDSTSFVFTAFIPSGFREMGLILLGIVPVLIAYAILKPGWRAMEREIKSFIENAPEFK
jgi:hypothetical protein